MTVLIIAEGEGHPSIVPTLMVALSPLCLPRWQSATPCRAVPGRSEFFSLRLNSITHQRWLRSLHIPDTLPSPEATKWNYGATALRWKRERTT
jgi:hypothetical protein